MGALVACLLALVAGGAVGSLLGSRVTRHLAGATRERIARSTVVLLGGSAGTLIAAQLDLFVRQLEANGSVASRFGGHSLVGAFDTIAVSETFHGVLLYGGALVGLATIVALLATREARAQRP
jgi:hypothetical protein